MPFKPGHNAQTCFHPGGGAGGKKSKKKAAPKGRRAPVKKSSTDFMNMGFRKAGTGY